jgi:hypothetical protein
MFSRIRKRLTYANVAVTLALVFAMSGGAYAAGRYVITSTKQISPKVLKQLKGTNGAAGTPGAPGSAGTAGAAGKEGPAGKEGSAGHEGLAGSPGTNGESVVSKAVSTTESTCDKAGGSSFTVGGSTTYACNGKEGSVGAALGNGQTETGQFAYTFPGEDTEHHWVAGEGIIAYVALSFPIPLAEGKNAEPHYIGPGEGEGGPKANLPAGCKGNVEKPQAEKGNLCVFANVSQSAEFAAFRDAGSDAESETGLTGDLLIVRLTHEEVFGEKQGAVLFGTWALTSK